MSALTFVEFLISCHLQLNDTFFDGIRYDLSHTSYAKNTKLAIEKYGENILTIRANPENIFSWFNGNNFYLICKRPNISKFSDYTIKAIAIMETFEFVFYEFKNLTDEEVMMLKLRKA